MQVVQVVQVVVRRWTRGDYVGGWVRTNRTRGGYPIASTVYEWRGEHRFGQWTTNQRVREFGSYAINGRIT